MCWAFWLHNLQKVSLLNSMRWAVSLSTRSGIDGKMLNHQLWLIIASGLRSDHIAQPLVRCEIIVPCRWSWHNHVCREVWVQLLLAELYVVLLSKGTWLREEPRWWEKGLVPLAQFQSQQFSVCSYQLKWYVHFSCYQNWSQEQFQNASSFQGKRDMLFFFFFFFYKIFALIWMQGYTNSW